VVLLELPNGRSLRFWSGLEYANLVAEGVTLQSSSYGSIFYVATGFHALHVTGGLIAFLW
jgi:heme/copper-type cytochrome/quinol oxidase subunit 3